MKLVVLLSGGIDSAVLLVSRLLAGDECLAVSFDYGQAHRRELAAAERIAEHYGVDHTVITLPPGILRGAAVIEGDAVVPARNLLMLSIAAAIGENWGAGGVVFGANKDDINGFPDCRAEFITAMDEAVRRGCTNCVSVDAPLHDFTKTEVVALGRRLAVPLDLTWSCYRGLANPCGECGACQLREEALN